MSVRSPCLTFASVLIRSTNSECTVKNFVSRFNICHATSNIPISPIQYLAFKKQDWVDQSVFLYVMCLCFQVFCRHHRKHVGNFVIFKIALRHHLSPLSSLYGFLLVRVRQDASHQRSLSGWGQSLLPRPSESSWRMLCRLSLCYYMVGVLLKDCGAASDIE